MLVSRDSQRSNHLNRNSEGGSKAAFLLPGGARTLYLLFFVSVHRRRVRPERHVLHGTPDWGILLPGDGAVQALVDAAFTPTFDRATGLLPRRRRLVGRARGDHDVDGFGV